jgi:hypothetical protein
MKLTIVGVTALALGASSGMLGIGLTETPEPTNPPEVRCSADDFSCESQPAMAPGLTDEISESVAVQLEDWQFALSNALTRIERHLWAETGYPPVRH